MQMLLRDVVTAQEGDGKACPFPLAETVACNTQPCPEQQPELRASDGDFEIHLGSEHTVRGEARGVEGRPKARVSAVAFASS